MYWNDYERNNCEESDFEQEPAFLTPREVMYELGIGRSTFYKIVNSGQLPAFKIGKLWRVKRQDIENFGNRKI